MFLTARDKGLQASGDNRRSRKFYRVRFDLRRMYNMDNRWWWMFVASMYDDLLNFCICIYLYLVHGRLTINYQLSLKNKNCLKNLQEEDRRCT